MLAQQHQHKLTLEVERPGVNLQRNKTDTVRQNLILHDRRVVPNVDILDGNSRNLQVSNPLLNTTHLGDHNTTKGVGNRSVHTDKVKLDSRGSQPLNRRDQVLSVSLNLGS